MRTQYFIVKYQRQLVYYMAYILSFFFLYEFDEIILCWNWSLFSQPFFVRIVPQSLVIFSEGHCLCIFPFIVGLPWWCLSIFSLADLVPVNPEHRSIVHVVYMYSRLMFQPYQMTRTALSSSLSLFSILLFASCEKHLICFLPWHNQVVLLALLLTAL